MNFVKMNKKTKKFKSSQSDYKYVSKIGSKAKETIIMNSKSENIHPSLWNSDWFEDKESAEEYLNHFHKRR